MNIPLLYIIIGSLLNLLYTLGWMAEITIIQTNPAFSVSKYRIIFLCSLVLVSIAAIFGFSLILLQ